jgi:RNA polymerase sigma-70 factor, ECF subfamily
MSERETNQQRSRDAACAELVERLYADLRAIAERHLREEYRNHTLQPTALVHEAYMKLLQQREVAWDNPAQALGLAAQAMRRVLVDHARGRDAAKRGGGLQRLALEHVDTPSPASDGSKAIDLLALEDALERLASIDSTQAKIVELRFFGGLSCDEVAETLGMAKRTVDREWAAARAWLYRRLEGQSSEDPQVRSKEDGREAARRRPSDEPHHER